MQVAAKPPPISRKAQMKPGDSGGEKAAAGLPPTGKLPPRAPEHAILNGQCLANWGGLERAQLQGSAAVAVC